MRPGKPMQFTGWAILFGIALVVMISSGRDPEPSPSSDRVPLDILIGVDLAMTQHFPAEGETALERSKVVTRDWIQATNLGRHRIGLVRLDSPGDLIHGLSKEESSLLTAIDGVESSRRTCLVAGLHAISRELSGPRRRPEARGIAILLTDGRSRATTAHRVARRLMDEEGISIVPVGLGPSSNETVLLAITSFPEALDSASDRAELLEIYRRWVRRLERHGSPGEPIE